MERLTVEVVVDQVKYRGIYSQKESKVVVEANEDATWKALGTCLWSGKHLIYRTAKINNTVYFLLEEKLSELK